MIHIKNRRKYSGSGIYVGREMPYLNLAGSTLGNRCKGNTRQQRISNYRAWLWEQIKLRNEVYAELVRIARLARRRDVTLICWCDPEPCHATVIARAIEWLIATYPEEVKATFDNDEELNSYGMSRVGCILEDDEYVEKIDKEGECAACSTPTRWQLGAYLVFCEAILPSGRIVRRDIELYCCSEDCARALRPHEPPVAEVMAG